MKALITGASSGIGRDMAIYLSDLGYDLIIVARREIKLEELKKQLKTKVSIIELDLSEEKNCYHLYEITKKENVDIVINNAGFGVYGAFNSSNLSKELKMIDVNIRCVHILTKLFLDDMKQRNSGYILNVASLAAFQAGPLMASYYATKAYILRITTAIYEELRRNKSNVVVACLCPGPVKTEFNDVAHVRFSMKYLSSEYVAKYAINKMLKKKLIIIPGVINKLAYFMTRLLPTKLLLKASYNIQKRKSC